MSFDVNTLNLLTFAHLNDLCGFAWMSEMLALT